MHVAALLLLAVAASGRDLDPQTCVDNFDVHRDKIIRTEDSREMGAKYLSEVDLGTRDECLRLCCETDTCDVFVFEEKSPGSCYLFHCGPPEDFKCKFTRHTNFSSAVLAVNRHMAELEDQIKLTKHEQDLASLRSSDFRPKYQEATTTPKTTTAAPPEPLPVSYQTRICSRYQFQCHTGEECIAIYNACDGIPQCSDGSDEGPELGCPTTTLSPPPPPPPNLPPREIIPRMPQIQQIPTYNGNVPERLSIQKDIQPQHQPPFMPPIQTQDTQGWPRRLEQIHQNSQIKQYDNLDNLHIFNHKQGNHQVPENDGGGMPVQYDYKPMSYEPMPDNNWDHRSWQQPQADINNMNDGSAMYHIDMQPQNGWKQQQPSQVASIPHRIPNQNQIQMARIPQGSMNSPDMPMIQDRDKMWVVPQMQNQQEKQAYNPVKLIPQLEEPFEVAKEKNTIVYPTQKVIKPDNTVQPQQKETKNENIASNQFDKQKEVQSDSKDTNSKMKKKPSTEHEKSNQEQKQDPMIEQILLVKDVHDGAAERPPGAILLLTLGVAMTSIMVVLIGCRLKMAKRRMRRNGKSPFAHDADYLVNGMYL